MQVEINQIHLCKNEAKIVIHQKLQMQPPLTIDSNRWKQGMARRKMMILLRFWKLISHGDVTAIAEARDGTEEDDDIVEVLEIDFRR